jgi:ferredoxin
VTGRQGRRRRQDRQLNQDELKLNQDELNRGVPGRPAQGQDEPDRPAQGQGEPGQGQRRSPAGQLGLQVNPVACNAHGLCIELLPELIVADPWGYPILRPGPVPAELLPLARRAVSACPTLALMLTRRP